MGAPKKYEEKPAKKIIGGGWTCDGCIFRGNNCIDNRRYVISHGYNDCQEKPIIYKVKS